MRIQPALFVLVLAGGCDLTLFPEQAEYVGGDTARASVDLSAEAMTDREDIEALEVEVVDLALHRPEDDAWVLLGAQTIRADLVQPPRGPAVQRVPVRPRAYDRIAFGLAAVRLNADGAGYELELEETEVEIAGDFEVDGDVVVQLRFDLDASIIGDTETGFAFDPVIEADVL